MAAYVKTATFHHEELPTPNSNTLNLADILRHEPKPKIVTPKPWFVEVLHGGCRVRGFRHQVSGPVRARCALTLRL